MDIWFINYGLTETSLRLIAAQEVTVDQVTAALLRRFGSACPQGTYEGSWSEAPIPGSRPGMADHAPNEVMVGVGPAGGARSVRFSGNLRFLGLTAPYMTS